MCTLRFLALLLVTASFVMSDVKREVNWVQYDNFCGLSYALPSPIAEMVDWRMQLVRKQYNTLANSIPTSCSAATSSSSLYCVGKNESYPGVGSDCRQALRQALCAAYFPGYYNASHVTLPCNAMCTTYAQVCGYDESSACTSKASSSSVAAYRSEDLTYPWASSNNDCHNVTDVPSTTITTHVNRTESGCDYLVELLDSSRPECVCADDYEPERLVQYPSGRYRGSLCCVRTVKSSGEYRTLYQPCSSRQSFPPLSWYQEVVQVWQVFFQDSMTIFEALSEWFSQMNSPAQSAIEKNDIL
jgi:hypothetical protein